MRAWRSWRTRRSRSQLSQVWPGRSPVAWVREAGRRALSIVSVRGSAEPFVWRGVPAGLREMRWYQDALAIGLGAVSDMYGSPLPLFARRAHLCDVVSRHSLPSHWRTRARRTRVWSWWSSGRSWQGCKVPPIQSSNLPAHCHLCCPRRTARATGRSRQYARQIAQEGRLHRTRGFHHQEIGARRRGKPCRLQARKSTGVQWG